MWFSFLLRWIIFLSVWKEIVWVHIQKGMCNVPSSEFLSWMPQCLTNMFHVTFTILYLLHHSVWHFLYFVTTFDAFYFFFVLNLWHMYLLCQNILCNAVYFVSWILTLYLSFYNGWCLFTFHATNAVVVFFIHSFHVKMHDTFISKCLALLCNNDKNAASYFLLC